ncbi:related to Protein HYM1 [Saccharomycodes ludwigii]|uniref:Related to Protein HYM1 n=1 Tax=Saccharomycodes ludwigii TaxID=36035 RepID=A0A376B6U8_9ASCO|nr:hypothetical protein SCDLUD_004294 [Saccharomycodes ludwigii]KAH3899978.1 hypothetical protein SCDLUD_004294 [Saccharomycodes ludwigii]SSD60415.1 related to Protein HYM1 [Saccharomycodes ludwigii]
MAFWWKKTPKTPGDYIKVLNDQLIKLDSTSTLDNKRKTQDECNKYIEGIRHMLFDGSTSGQDVHLLYVNFFKTECLHNILVHFNQLGFEARKNVAIIFCNGLTKSMDNKFIYVDYLITKTDLIYLLLKTQETALLNRSTASEVYVCLGGIVDECLKFEQLARIILKDPIVWKYFDNCLSVSFEISTQSFQILNSLFLNHKKLVATEYFNIKANMDTFTVKINKLLAHGNYVTKRQAVKLLSTLILSRANNQFMINYINESDNLKLIMVLLSDKSKNLQLESFNVFKVFVANPRKSKQVSDILIKNREKLLKFFEGFGEDNRDSTFLDEKEFIIQQINELPRIVLASKET